MRCQDVCASMAAFVDWELPPAQSRAIARHIARCGDCRQWYREVLDLAEAWHDDREVPGLDLTTPIRERLRAEPPGHGSPARRAATTWRTPQALPGRRIFLHYIVAASMALILFNLGVFQHVGALAHHGAALSGHVTGFVQILARL